MADTRDKSTGTERSLRCVVVTPETTLLDATVEFVALPLYDGEIGIAPHHSPMIGRLGYGEMRIVDSEGTQSYYVDGGFVQVAENTVSVITNRALPASDLDSETTAEQLAAIQQESVAGEELMTARDRRTAQARAQLRISRKAK